MEGAVDFEAELESMDLGSRQRMDAAISIICMLGRAPDLPVADRFVARTAQAAVDACAAEAVSYDYFGHNASNELAVVVLSLPGGAALL